MHQDLEKDNEIHSIQWKAKNEKCDVHKERACISALNSLPLDVTVLLVPWVFGL